MARGFNSMISRGPFPPILCTSLKCNLHTSEAVQEIIVLEPVGNTFEKYNYPERGQAVYQGIINCVEASDVSLQLTGYAFSLLSEALCLSFRRFPSSGPYSRVIVLGCWSICHHG